MKKNIITSIIFIIIVLSVVQVAVSNSLSTTGIVLSRFDRDVSYYAKENAALRETLLLTQSLTFVASKAATLGFIEEKSQIVIGTSLPVALKP